MRHWVGITDYDSFSMSHSSRRLGRAGRAPLAISRAQLRAEYADAAWAAGAALSMPDAVHEALR